MLSLGLNLNTEMGFNLIFFADMGHALHISSKTKTAFSEHLK